MDQIRPIGPIERDIDPIFRVQPPGDERERPDPRERPPQPQRKQAPQPPPEDHEDGGSLIDIRV